jgi:hypothetical protein
LLSLAPTPSQSQAPRRCTCTYYIISYYIISYHLHYIILHYIILYYIITSTDAVFPVPGTTGMYTHLYHIILYIYTIMFLIYYIILYHIILHFSALLLAPTPSSRLQSHRTCTRTCNILFYHVYYIIHYYIIILYYIISYYTILYCIVSLL